MKFLNILLDNYKRAKAEWDERRKTVQFAYQVPDSVLRQTEHSLAAYMLAYREYIKLDLPEGVIDDEMTNGGMIAKAILFFGQPCVLACDGKCWKAWGINNRPSAYKTVNGDYEVMDRDQANENSIVPDYDDYAHLADNELGDAPIDPGTYEGDQAKPQQADERLNKWCARECERSTIVDIGQPIELKDYSQRRYNSTPHERA